MEKEGRRSKYLHLLVEIGVQCDLVLYFLRVTAETIQTHKFCQCFMEKHILILQQDNT